MHCKCKMLGLHKLRLATYLTGDTFSIFASVKNLTLTTAMSLPPELMSAIVVPVFAETNVMHCSNQFFHL